MLQKIIEIQKANSRYDADYEDYIADEVVFEKNAQEIKVLIKEARIEGYKKCKGRQDIRKYQIAREVMQEYLDDGDFHAGVNLTLDEFQDGWLAQQEEK